MSERTLLVVGATLDDAARERIARREEPRRDFSVLRDSLTADVLDPGSAGFRTSPLAGVRLAHEAARIVSRYDHVFTDSEHIALPLAALLRLNDKRVDLTTIGHYLSPVKKRLASRAVNAASFIRGIAIHSEAQRPRAWAMGFDDRQVALIPYQVDTQFWHPQERPSEDQVCAAGLEFRDYGTMLEAMRQLDIRAEIAVSSPWSKRKANFKPGDVPSNVRVVRHDYAGLRDMYARSRLVIVPLRDVDFQAGIITILEAMAMGKAVIATRTRGQLGTVSGPLFSGTGRLGEIVEQPEYHPNGLYVVPGQPGALRNAIKHLLMHPEEAARMGANGRRLVADNLGIEHFASRMSAFIRGGA